VGAGLRVVCHVDDLDAAVFGSERVVGVFQLALAVAGRNQGVGRDVVVVDEEFLDGFRATLREALILVVGALGIGVPAEHHDRTG